MVQAINVLVAGSTGMLGESIIKGLLEYENIVIRVILSSLKPKDERKRRRITHYRKKGIAFVEGSLTEQKALDKATKGIDVVISAVSEFGKDVLEGQQALIDASLQNQVQVFVPSNFVVYEANITQQDNSFVYAKKQINEYLSNKNIKQFIFSNGIFFEYLDWFCFDEDKRSYYFYTEKDQNFQIIAVDDVGKYVAAALHDPEMWNTLPTQINLCSEEDLTIAKFEQYLKDNGDNTPVEILGSPDTAREIYSDIYKRNPDDVFAWFVISLHSFFPTDRTTPPKFQNNLFPDIKP